MAGSAVSELIFFIAAIMISSAVAVTLIEVVDDYSADLGDEASALRWEMRSQMEVINDPMYVPYDTSEENLTLYIKNTGSGDLSMEALVVSANGTARSGDLIWAVVMGEEDDWAPGTTLEIDARIPDLEEGVDYQGWVHTSGSDSDGSPTGTAKDNFVFRIMEV